LDSTTLKIGEFVYLVLWLTFLTDSLSNSWTMSSDVVWKSVGVAYSSDNGFSWRDGGQILRHPQNKPANPTWGGVGDMDVLWDPFRRRWMCYFSDGRMSMATSTDANAGPGTWLKWNQGSELSIRAGKSLSILTLPLATRLQLARLGRSTRLH
jgi:hypothetical protein